MQKLERALKIMLGHEGGYANDPQDLGGETMWGVTAKVARADGYEGAMINLPIERAVEIYSTQYWDERLNVLPFPVVFNIFDAAVNHGKRQSLKFAQRAAGADDDGIMGADTLAAIARMDSYDFSLAFNAERLEFYCNLRTFTRFGKGWTRRVANNLRIR